LLVSLLTAAGAARAAPATTDLVILLEPADASPVTLRSLRRIKDEVSADRFEVVVATPETATGAVSATWNATRGALIVLLGDPSTGRAELCVVSRTTKRTAVRRATVVDTPETMPEVLASRALELLRATALELSLDAPVGPTPAEPQPRPPDGTRPAASSPTADEPTPLLVDTGLALVQSLNGPPPSVAPILRLGVRVATWLDVRASASGLGTRPRVESPYGSATVSQSFVLLELVTLLTRHGALRPMASLGGGLLHIAISGQGTPPYVGRDAQQWAASIDGGVGLALPFRSRAALVAELHCLLASPHPSIRFVDTKPATIGYPSLVLTLALRVMP
jgi:hypothetical protein